jgi:hypothetical protein
MINQDTSRLELSLQQIPHVNVVVFGTRDDQSILVAEATLRSILLIHVPLQPFDCISSCK